MDPVELSVLANAVGEPRTYLAPFALRYQTVTIWRPPKTMICEVQGVRHLMGVLTFRSRRGTATRRPERRGALVSVAKAEQEGSIGASLAFKYDPSLATVAVRK